MNRSSVGLLSVALLCVSCERESAAPTPVEARALRFTEVSGAWGLDFVHDCGASAEKRLPETMGAGAALFDCDEDGDLDLYLVQSGPLPLTPDRSQAPPNRLFRNVAAGAFVDATAESGDAAHRGYGMGVCVGDADADGHDDLYVTNLGPDVLLAGDGAGSFRDVTHAAGLADERWTAGALFLDPDADGDLDLYVTAYLELDLAAPEFCGEPRPGWRSYCHPDRYEGLQDRYWRNRGDGSFEDATVAAGLADGADRAGGPGKGLGAIAGDFDGDGALDVYVANDSVENRLWAGRGDGRFEDATLLSGTGVNGFGMTEAGMGLALGDVDGDLAPELYVTNFDDESNTLYHNDGGGFFTDVTARVGLEGPTRLMVGFGTVLEDFDLDGDLDVAVANGHIIDNIELYHDGKRWKQPAQLFENDGGGRFRDASADAGELCATPFVGRGLYGGDLDLDGDVDLVLTQCGGPLRVFRNDSPARPTVEVHGAPRHAALLFERSDGRVLRREAGPPPSYFGSGSDVVRCATGAATITGLRLRVPGDPVPERVLSVPAEGERFELRSSAGEYRLIAR